MKASGGACCHFVGGVVDNGGKVDCGLARDSPPDVYQLVLSQVPSWTTVDKCSLMTCNSSGNTYPQLSQYAELLWTDPGHNS